MQANSPQENTHQFQAAIFLLLHNHNALELGLYMQPSYNHYIIVMTKNPDKFASSRQVNSPNSIDKLKMCCTEMYSVRFLVNFAVFFYFWDIVDLLEICSSETKQNIRSPTGTMCKTCSLVTK